MLRVATSRNKRPDAWRAARALKRNPRKGLPRALCLKFNIASSRGFRDKSTAHRLPPTRGIFNYRKSLDLLRADLPSRASTPRVRASFRIGRAVREPTPSSNKRALMNSRKGRTERERIDNYRLPDPSIRDAARSISDFISFGKITFSPPSFAALNCVRELKMIEVLVEWSRVSYCI